MGSTSVVGGILGSGVVGGGVGGGEGGGGGGGGGKKVFVYGSLMANEVVTVLLNRLPQSDHATLHGFHRFSIKGRVYPAILPVENGNVAGKLFSGVTADELFILDAFEDDEYERRTVEVALLDKTEKVQAYTYVWHDNTDTRLYGDWNFEEWRGAHMDGFVKMTAEFMEELELPQPKKRTETYTYFYPQNDDTVPTS